MHENPSPLADHPYFKLWRDPRSGVASYILHERVAPIQQHNYFADASLSGDEKLLWIYCAYPPSNYRTMAVIGMDPDQPFIRYFPNSQLDGRPTILPGGNEVLYTLGRELYKIDVEGKTTLVLQLDPAWVNQRRVGRLSTHTSVSCDSKYVLLDGQIGNHWFVAIGDLATGEVKVLREFQRHQNHAQFSPTDPNLFSIAQDHSCDPVTGQFFDFDHRVWLMDIQQTRFEPLRPKEWNHHGFVPSHEWWSNDGKLCYIDYKTGIYECDAYTGEQTHVWKGMVCHAHCNADRTLWCADESPYKWHEKPLEVTFFNRNSDKLTHIVSAMPPPPIHRNLYHIDPHPQFSPKGTHIVYTTTVLGKVDVAFAPVGPLLAE